MDGSTINLVDVTGAEMLESLTKELAARSIRFGLANARREVRTTLERAGMLKPHRTRIHVSDPQQRKRRVPFPNKCMNSIFPQAISIYSWLSKAKQVTQ